MSTTVNDTLDDAILVELTTVMQQTFPDRDPPEDVGPDTRILADIGLVSIDVIVLAEKLESHFGQKLAFPQFLASLRARNAEDITVGELVAFLREQIRH